MQKRRNFLINTAFWVVILAIIYFIFKYFINLIMPFFLATVFAALSRPISRLLSGKNRVKKLADGSTTVVRRKISLNYNLSAIIGVTLVYLILLGLILLIVIPVVDFAVDLFSGVPQLYEESILPGLETALQSVYDLPAKFPPSIRDNLIELLEDAVPNLISALGTFVTNFSGTVVKWVSSFATSLPTALLRGLITIIATVFIALDYDSLRAFIYTNLHTEIFNVVVDVRDSLVDIVWQFIRSYFFIFLITAAEISVGLLLIGIKKPLLIALLTAIFDAFPIVGSGMILLPWAVITMIVSDFWKGFGLFIVYLVVVIVRQIIEPKIVGRHVGLRPIVSLVAMFIGNRLFGGIGLFGLPIMIAIITDLNDNGTLHLYKSTAVVPNSDEDSGSSTPQTPDTK